jgi:hypothetical protein
MWLKPQEATSFSAAARDWGIVVQVQVLVRWEMVVIVDDFRGDDTWIVHVHIQTALIIVTSSLYP